MALIQKSSSAYLAYVYVKSGSIIVTSIAHITMNNAASSFSYFVILQNQTLANLSLTLTMPIVVALMVAKKMFASAEFSSME